MITVLPLGAGQDVGRSCIIVTFASKTVMFDCGMHMGYHDDRRFPDFTAIAPNGDLTAAVDVAIISHFHLDHCGALPFFTEQCGYKGPVVMTHPTRTICPLLLEDYRKIMVERKGEQGFFTSAMISLCMARVVGVGIMEPIEVGGVRITAFYAGHVLGAAMFYVQSPEGESVLYTGDFNMTPDRHLGAARIPVALPNCNVLITESTYATTTRESKRSREREFLRNVHECVARGGKVLIPTFALGRAQELCLLLDTYWTRMGLDVPVYFSAGLAERATEYYGMYLAWTNESVQAHPTNPFKFKHIRPFERHLVEQPGPMVLFSTPGMLHSGQSLQVFARWAPDPANLLIIPGYCVAGTVGAKVLAGHKQVEVDGVGSVKINLEIRNLSFSAHADAKGIMQLIECVRPRNVVLVHGEKHKMGVLKERVLRELSIPCYDPANGQYLYLASEQTVSVDVDARVRGQYARDVSQAATQVLKSALEDKMALLIRSAQAHSHDTVTLRGVLTHRNGEYTIRPVEEYSGIEMRICITKPACEGKGPQAMASLYEHLVHVFHPHVPIFFQDSTITARSLRVKHSDNSLEFSWGSIDDNLGKSALQAFHKLK